MGNGVNPCASFDAESGRTMLQYAVMRGDLNKVKYLLQFCSKTGINATDKKGRTAFHLSINIPVYFHSILITKVLFRHHASVNIADSLGQSPLHRACILGELLFVQELLNRGSMVHLKDGSGRVPLECCRQVKHSYAVGMSCLLLGVSHPPGVWCRARSEKLSLN